MGSDGGGIGREGGRLGTDGSREKIGLTILRIVALAVIALHLLAPLLPEDSAWGVWPYTYLPTWARWVLAVAAVLVIFAPDLPRFRLPRLRPCLWLPIAGFPLFWLARIVHTRWGDAYILIHAIPHPKVHLTYTWQAPFDVYIHAKLWALGHRLWGWPDPTPVYWLLSSLCGVAFLYVVCRLAAFWEKDDRRRIVLFFFLTTLGTVELFFGYIENYTFAALGVTIYLYLALRTLRGDTPLLWPATALAITHGFHPSTIVLDPSLLYLGWAWYRSRSGRSLMDAAFQIAAPMIVVGGAVVTLLTLGGHGIHALLSSDRPGGGDARLFVPLFRTTSRWEHYTMFSWGHLLDMVNEQLLTAPTLLAALISLLAIRPALPRSREGKFLTLAAGFYLLFIWTWNPDYGGRRDWDLFSLAAIPLAFLTWHFLRSFFRDDERGLKAAAALTAVQIIHTAAWVYQNTIPWHWPKG